MLIFPILVLGSLTLLERPTKDFRRLRRVLEDWTMLLLSMRRRGRAVQDQGCVGPSVVALWKRGLLILSGCFWFIRLMMMRMLLLLRSLILRVLYLVEIGCCSLLWSSRDIIILNKGSGSLLICVLVLVVSVIIWCIIAAYLL